MTGPGGVGKTRLALAVASQVAGDYPDGVWFVDLSPLIDHRLVLTTLASVLGVTLAGNRPVREALTEALVHSHSLLLIDNVEHVIEAAREVGALIHACPHLTVLATSRAPLRVQGEREYPLAPMELDVVDATGGERFLQSEAVQVFVQRAQAVRPDFALTDDNSMIVLAICQRLDGIPLAIELAAAHIRVLSPQAMLWRLEHRLTLLVGGPVDLPPRQQTLRNTIAWSYDLLSPDEQHVFQRLSVFRGGWTLESAEAVTGDDEVIGRLERLVEHSLVRVREQSNGEPRYSMLETIREFGLERLAVHQQEHEAYDRHGRYFLMLAEDAIPSWRTSEHTRHYGYLETELDNLRAALSWFIDRDVQLAGRLSGALWRFFIAHGSLGEGRQWLERTLPHSSSLSLAVRARVLEGIGTLAYMMSDYAVVRQCFEKALPLWEEVGDLKGIAWSHHAFGRVAYETGDHAHAEHHYLLSLEASRQAGDLFGIAEMLNVLGVLAVAEGKDEQAGALYAESLGLRRKIGDQFGIQQSLSNLGCVAMRAGSYPQARLLFEESLAIGRKYQLQRVVETQELLHLGILARLQGDYQRAAELLAQSIDLFRRQGSLRWVVHCLKEFAQLAVLNNQPARAASIAGSFDLLVDQGNIHIFPVEQVEYDRAVERARHLIGEDAWIAAWASGRVMSMDEAVEYVLNTEDATSD